MFYRSYDGVSFASQMDPATVSTFRLDRFEVTVGRFRGFVEAMVGGWLPAAGAGKHLHLNGGGGLNGGSEGGWNPSWNSNLASTPTAWNSNLTFCGPTLDTWTASPGTSEDLPINCITWYEAYAFCIWDDAFLPSEAEWNYAAAGGSEQRAYPWSKPPMSTALGCSDANYSSGTSCGQATWKSGTASPTGDGRWLQADLAGNVQEWVLDSYQTNYPDPCRDCAVLGTGLLAMNRGGSFQDPPSALLASARPYDTPTYRSYTLGTRCARAP
jgi:formylglycine-generating enzyme required for sulfatase activity